MNVSRVALVTAVAGVLAGGLAACSATSQRDDSTVLITAGFYPLAWTAGQVAGEHAQVINLTTPGQEPHDVELSVQATVDITTSDLVVVESGVQPAVDDSADINAHGTVLDAADVIALHDDAGTVDPHFWHDPLLVADLGDAIAAQLADLDPDHATAYADNAARLRIQLMALDKKISIGLADCVLHDIVVSHDAFGYLAKYGLVVHGIAGFSPDAEPDPGTLTQLHDLITQTGITTVFSEVLVSKAAAESLASDLGISTAVLDPIEGLTDSSSNEDYLSLMRTNLAALRKANDC